MKIRFSKITKGFTLAGFAFGVLVVILSTIYAAGNEAVKAFISSGNQLMLLLCPPSIVLIAFDNHPATSEIIGGFVEIVVVNTLLYAVAGLVISQIYHLGSRLMQSGNKPH